MKNIIKIKEENNRLEFSDNYTPIVCGNSNYVLKFAFSEQWQKCIKKAAFFVIDGNKLTVDFEGDECKVPVLPNAAFVFVSLVSGEGEDQLATTPIRIRLEPTMAGGDFSEFNQLTNYLPKVLGAINDIESGEVIAKNAEYASYAQNAENSKFAQSASSAESAQIANIASNVSNSNLLINSDFRINQRGQSSYVNGVTAMYTVDRWRISLGSSYAGACVVNTKENGGVNISYNNTLAGGNTPFIQVLENPQILIGKTLTFSLYVSKLEGSARFRISNYSMFATGNLEEGLNFITFNVPSGTTQLFCGIISNAGEAANIDIDWAKLEIGNNPTTYTPRLYAEELALCQRYFQKCYIDGFCKNASSSNIIYPTINLGVDLRTAPTLIVHTMPKVSGNSIAIENVSEVSFNTMNSNKFITLLIRAAVNITSGLIYCITDGDIDLDAELY